jgi:hypothetical protein
MVLFVFSSVKVAKWAVPRVFAGPLTCIPIRGPTSADPVLRAKTLLSLILQQNSKPGLLEMVIAGRSRVLTKAMK